ncbi:hypothetical protein EZV62_006700 [Acer yangbiense]|uniref:Pectinesterase inhibitor domain-containing protein n=1 Tax=Acer yangbiense TaxID=1000413 RepID=A0A5C7I8B6_9ROSI|nr:hypothetical protein EZV62_006700 [Acer yangbiense]
MDSHFQRHVLIQMTIFFFLFIHSLPSTNANLIDDACNVFKDPRSCISALKQDPKIISAPDFKTLAKNAVRFAISNSTDSKNFIQDMAQKSTEPTLKKALESCLSERGYGYVIRDFKIVLREIDEDPESASYDAMVAQDGAQYCEETLASSGLKVDSVTTRNDYVKLYSIVCSAVMDKI